MAVLNICGFELGSVDEIFTVSGGPTIQTTIKRSGSYAARVNAGASAQVSVQIRMHDAIGLDTSIARSAQTWYTFWFRFEALPSSTAMFAHVDNSSTGMVANLRVASTGAVTLVGSTTSSTIATVSTGTWYRMDLRCTSSGTCGAAINGGTEQTVTAAGASLQNALNLGRRVATTTDAFDCYYDDVFISSTGFPGNGEVRLCLPDGDGTYTAWGDGTGVTFAEVDDIPFDTATYIKALSTGSNTRRTFTLQSCATVGISGTILAVKPGIVSRSESVSGTSACGMRVRSGSTDNDTTGFEWPTTFDYYAKVFDTDPATSAAWTISGMDGLEVGVFAGTIAQAQRCTLVGANVWFTPAAGVTTGVAVETDTAFARPFFNTKFASETNTAITRTLQKNLIVGLAIETDTALALSLSPPLKSKDIYYEVNGIPTAFQANVARRILIVADSDIAAECATGGGIRITDSTGTIDLPFGLYPDTDLAAGTVHARFLSDRLATAVAGVTVQAKLIYSSSITTVEDKAGVVIDSYVVYCPLDQSTADIAANAIFDWVTNGYIGYQVGGLVGNATAQVGKGISPDGTTYGSAGYYITPTEITLEIIGKLNSHDGSNGEVLVDRGCTVSSDSYQFYIQPDRSVRFVVDDGGSNNAINIVTATGVISDSVLYGFALTKDSINFRAFIDGAIQGTVATSSNIIYGITDHTYLGRNGDGSLLYNADAVLDELRIASITRTNNRILCDYYDDFDNANTFSLSAEQGGGATGISVGVATETDTAFALTLQKSTATGLATETDTAFALTLQKNIATGLATETDTAFALTLAPPAPGISVGVATETDTAFALTLQKNIATGLATETDTAFALTLQKNIAIGLVIETDNAFAPILSTAFIPSSYPYLLTMQ